MVLSKEEQERIRKRWESHNGVSPVSPPNDVSAAAESGGTETETGTETSAVNDSDKQRIRNRWSQRFGVDESYINTFLTDANKFLTQAQSDYNKLDWSSATAESSLNYYKAMEQTENRLSDRAQNIQNFLNARKSDMDEETYNNLSSYLKNFTSPQFSKLFFDARDYYSQWESAEAYDTAVREHGYQTKYEGKSYSDIQGILANMEDGEEKDWLTNYAPSVDYKEKLELDVSAAEAEIEELDEYVSEALDALVDYLPGTDEYDAQVAKWFGKYGGSTKAMEAYVIEKKRYLADAKRVQYLATLTNVSQNEDFKENSGYSPTGLNYKNPMVAVYSTDIDALTYEFINNVDKARNYIVNNYTFTWNGVGKNYEWMKPEEVAIYNYHYKTNGKEKAREYLDSIQEILNHRAGNKIAAEVKDKPVLPYLVGAAAGLDQFGTGLKNAVEGLFGEKTYIPTSSLQYASQSVREELGKSGVKLPEWLGGATLGQAAYDVINTGANMAPTILVSAMTGGAGGAALGTAALGVSAGGNAYQQALNQGYGKEKALAYGTMIGVSEAVLQKALGGIGKLGGASKAVSGLATKAVSGIDNAILRFSLKYSAQLAGKVGSEALEEGLQSILEPIFQQAILNNDAQIDWEEVAYSALLGGAMGGTFGGVELTAEVKADHKANVSLGKEAMAQENFQAEFQGVLNQALQMPQNSEAYHLAVAAQKKIAGGKQLSEAEVGALYRETAMEVVKGEKENSAPEMSAEHSGKLSDLNFPRTMVDYKDFDGRRALEDNISKDLISRGKTTKISKLPTEIDETNWHDKNTARDKIRNILKRFLGKNVVFNHGEQSAIAYLTSDGIRHTVAGWNTKGKAGALAEFYSLVNNAEYCYSSKNDSHSVDNGNAEWDYFVSVAQVENETIPLVFAIRSSDQDTRSQIYSIATKENPTIPRGDGTQNESANAHPITYGDSSSSEGMITQRGNVVNTEGGNQNGETTGNQPIGAANIAAGEGSTGGTAVSDGEQRGPAGTGAHEQAAPVAGATGQSQRADGRRAAFERQNRIQAIRDSVRDAIPVSPREVGIPGGSTDTTMKIVPIAYQTEEMKNVSDWFEERGVRAYFFVGSLSIQQGGQNFIANGVLNGDYVFIKADSPNFDLEQIAEHEKFHLIKRENPGLVEQLVHELQELPEADFSRIVDKYIKAYGSIVDMSRDGAELRIWNEILADAYAGINARGVDVAAYQDEVVQRVQKYTGEGRQAQSNGVRQTNGPNSQTVENEGAEFSLAEIVDSSNKSYGIGVMLDSTLLDGLSDSERIAMVKEYIKELGGGVFTAYDATGNEIDITIADYNKKFKNSKGKRIPVNKDLTEKYNKNTTKQEAIALVDELIISSRYEGHSPPVHPHDWLDDYGKNDFEYWKTYIQDRSGEIWEATLNIANTVNGEKILYDIYPIKNVGRSGKSDTIPTKDNIRDSSGNVNSENSEAEFALGSEPVDIEERMRRYENVPEYRPGMESSAAAEGPDVDRLMEWDRVTNDGSTKPDYEQNVPKSEFVGTPHMRELGIQIENSVGDYWGTAAAVANDRAAKQMKRQIKRAETQLNATEAEKDFAAGIASGKYYVEDIPGRLDEYVVRELAEYYAAEEALDTDLLREKKASISSGLFETMKELFRDSDAFTPSAALVQNYRTPERNMLKIFGAQRGKAINDAIFSAVAVNEAERYRFMNRMFDEVRTFEDSKGKKRELTKQERAMVMMHIEGKAASEIAAGMEMSGPINHAAENIAKGKDSSDEAREWGLGREERRLAEQVAVWIEVKEAMDSGKVDAKVIDEAAQKYSEMFNKFYDAINDFLVAHGYETIGFVRGYAPHIQPEQVRTTMNKAFHKMGIDADVGNLPASIAGMTADFKPNKRWNPHMQHRRTIKTQYDIAKAYESYVEYMSDIMYHTDDIMRVRQAANYFRRTYAPEEIKNMLEWAEELRKEKRPEQKAAFLRANGKLGNASSMSVKDIDEQFNEFVDEQYRQIENAGKYSELVKYLDNYANILAGKQSYRDRGSEANGRALMAAGNKLVQMFARSQVAGSISSALNQTAQLPQIIAEVGDVNVAHALWDMVTGKLRRAAWAQESDFLTGKKGVDFLVTEGGEKMISALFTPASFVDGTISTLAVRGEYLKQIKAGKSHAEAMKLADKKGTAIMGSRMKGSKPVAFHAKNFFDSIINVFQIEALNSWEHLSQDLPRDFHEIAETKGKRAAAGALANVLVKMILAAFIINRLDDELYGGTPAPFDVLGLTANFIASGEGLTTNQYLCTVFDNAWEKMTGDRPFDTDASELGGDFNWKNAVEDTVYNISNEIPFVRNISALMGAGDDTLPLPDVAGSVKDAYDAILDGKTEKLPEVAFGMVADMIPGGRQLEKTAQGLDVFFRGGKYSGYGDDAKLQYKVEQNAVNFIKSILFGRSGLGQSEFYASGGKSLTSAQTQAIEKLEAAGYDGMQIYDMMLKFRDLEPKEGEQKVTELQKCMEVAWSAWPEDMKAAVLETMMSESAYQMYKSAHDAGVTTYEYFELMGSIDELEPEDGNKEVSNLQKYMEVAMTPWPEQMKTATLEGMMPESSYQKYKEALDAGVTTYWYFKFLDDIQDLQSDKDENGKTVNGSLKKKVVAVIDGMKLSARQKDALFLTKYAESGLDEVPWN